MPIYIAATLLERARAMTDAPRPYDALQTALRDAAGAHSCDADRARADAGLIPVELLDGKPKQGTAWIAVEAIESVGLISLVSAVSPSRTMRVAVFALTLHGGRVIECSDGESTSEPVTVNLARTSARREAILDLWAAARLKAKAAREPSSDTPHNGSRAALITQAFGLMNRAISAAEAAKIAILVETGAQLVPVTRGDFRLRELDLSPLKD